MPGKSQKTISFTPRISVFGSFGDTELHNPLGLDLDGLASGRITAYASLAIDQNELAQPRNGEGVFGIFVSQLRDIYSNISTACFLVMLFFSAISDAICDLLSALAIICSVRFGYLLMFEGILNLLSTGKPRLNWLTGICKL